MSWKASDPLPAVPQKYHNFSDESKFDAWLDVRLDKIVDSQVVRGLWWNNENINRKTGRPVTITREQAKELWKINGGSWCRYLGFKGSWVPGSRYLLSLDKIDVTRGYEDGNLIICLDRMNDARFIYPISDFLDWRDTLMALPWRDEE